MGSILVLMVTYKKKESRIEGGVVTTQEGDSSLQAQERSPE